MTNRQVNAPLRRSNDLPYGFSRPPILSNAPSEGVRDSIGGFHATRGHSLKG